ncbi:MAG TPA: c-type cytochrome [Candidatus Acidoferrales bacterium]|nr:c-type cytochrome [Candidatus Acidoferrales bacterium]
MNTPLPGCLANLFAICVTAACLTAGFGVARATAAQEKAADDSAQKIADGDKLFHARCGYCHLAGGTGTYMLGKRLGKDRALLEARTDLTVEYIKKITRVGINSMPPHNRIELPDNELDLIAIYLTRPASARQPKPPTGAGHE